MPRDPAAPGFHVRVEKGSAVIVARAGARPKLSRHVAEAVVIVGLSGLAALSILRAPLLFHAIFVVLFASAVVRVASGNAAARAGLIGEILVDTARQRLTRDRGLEILPWKELFLPSRAVLVVETVRDMDPQRVLRGWNRVCRLTIIPVSDDPNAADHAWEAQKRGELGPGIPAAEGIPYDSARGFAEALARVFSWEIFDLAASEPERRDVGCLDVALQDRVSSLLSQFPEPLPTLARPWGASVWKDPVGTHVALRSIGFAALLIQLVLAFPLLAFLFLLSGGNWGLPLLGVALLSFSAGERAHLELRADRAVIRRLNVWLPLGAEDVVWWDEVEQIQALTERTSRGVRLVRDSGSVFVPTSSRAAARWAVAAIRDHLVGELRSQTSTGPQDTSPRPVDAAR